MKVLLIILIIVAAILLLVATVYLVSKTIDGIERIKHNEGGFFPVKNHNSEVIDPDNPYIFRLTEEEAQHIMKQDKDPLVTRIAIIALRAEISGVLKNAKFEMPAYLNRHGFWRSDEDKKVQLLLDKVRSLREGELEKVEIGPLTFNIQNPPAYSDDQGNNGMPSAPHSKLL